ncbi:MAG: AMP-binding protein [Betaproteobacteria bacterium]|nr:AMP-binding protein [Betaproteobacteria bacterium]
MTPLHALRLNARRFPRKPAMVFEGGVMDYSALFARVERMMSAFAGLGLASGDKVAILALNHPDFVAAYFALTGIGAIPAPVNYRITEDDMAQVVQASDARMLLLGAGFEDKAARLGALVRDTVLIGGARADAAPGALELDELLRRADGPPPAGLEGSTVMLHTSGTTGLPKGALRSRFGFEERALEQGFCADDRMLCALPICLSVGCVYTLLPLYLGATVYLMDGFDPAEALQIIQRERVTATMLLPAMLQRMVEQADFREADTSSVRTLQSGGGELHGALKRALMEKFGDALSIYAASSEVGPYANLRGAELRAHLGGNCVGRVFFGVELKLLDDEGREVPTGAVGEIWARSESRYDEYYKDAELTASTRRGDYLSVGDLGRFDADGLLYFAGRKRDIIKSGGINIYAPEIEEAIQTHPAVREVSCIGLPDRQWTELVCAVVVPRPGSRVDAEDILAHAAQRLASYKKPRRVVFVEEFPRNLTGRVLKNALIEMVQQKIAAEVAGT